MAVEPDHAVVAEGIRDGIAVHERLLEQPYIERVVRAADMVVTSLRGGGKLVTFGNGGSAADAQHMAAELLGRYLLDRAPLPAVCLTDNVSTMSAIGNDYGFDDVFARQVAGLGRVGDVAIAFSTSGDSPNVLAGVAAARAIGMPTIGLTGAGGGALASAVDLCIRVPADGTPRIQEGHTLVAHLICELAERALAADG